jgi:hypothetical protein
VVLDECAFHFGESGTFGFDSNLNPFSSGQGNAYSMLNRQMWRRAIVGLPRRMATGGAYLPPLIFFSNGASPIPL